MLHLLDGIVNKMTVTFKLWWYTHSSIEQMATHISKFMLRQVSQIESSLYFNQRVKKYRLQSMLEQCMCSGGWWYRFSTDTKAMQTISFHSTLELIKCTKIIAVFQFNLATESKQNIHRFGIISQKQLGQLNIPRCQNEKQITVASLTISIVQIICLLSFCV